MTDEIEPPRRKPNAWQVLAAVFVIFLFIEAILLPAPWTVAGLRTRNPKTTAIIKERLSEAGAMHEHLTIRISYVPLSKIPASLVHAVVVGEDGTFYENGGIDWFEVRESFEADLDAMKIVRGSSTITMQLAKNLWFSTSRNPLTKFNEMISAYMLNYYLSKNRIMELYLNYIEFGRGIFGVGAASGIYFGEPVSALTRDQAARLAAIIPSPIKHSPNSTSRFVSFRTEVILDRMQARGW